MPPLLRSAVKFSTFSRKIIFVPLFVKDLMARDLQLLGAGSKESSQNRFVYVFVLSKENHNCCPIKPQATFSTYIQDLWILAIGHALLLKP